MKFNFLNKMDKASALVMALVLVLVLAFIGLGLTQLGRNARTQAARSISVISAREAADAGIEHAVRFMIDSWDATTTNKTAWLASWNDPSSETAGVEFGPVSLSDTFGGATFKYTINKGTLAEGYQITSTGTAAGKTRTVHATVMLRSLFIGIGVKEKIEISPVDVYVVPSDADITIQTNSIAAGAVEVKPDVTIPGDLVCGPDGDPDVVIEISSNVVIKGEIKAAEEELIFPPVYIPAELSALPFGTPTIDAADSTVAHIYGDMKLDELQFGIAPLVGVLTLYIHGDVSVFVDGITKLAPTTRIVVTKGSSLILYLGGDMQVKPGSDILYSDITPVTEAEIVEAADSISIRGTVASDGTPLCFNVEFRPDHDFYGNIYAPDAALVLEPGGDYCGSVASRSIELKPTGTFVYVPSLASNIVPLSMCVKKGSWWEE